MVLAFSDSATTRTHKSIGAILVSPSSSVSMPYFTLDVPMFKCITKTLVHEFHIFHMPY